ncbi:MAG: type II secretion system protein N [Myxococcota bacterium]
MAPELRPVLVAAALVAALTRPAGAAEPAGGIRLLGTIVSSDASRSLAVIEQGGAQRLLRAGGDFGGATVVEIKSDGVVLQRGGRSETLALQAAPRPLDRAASLPASPAPADEDGSPSSPESAGAGPGHGSAAGASPTARRPASRAPASHGQAPGGQPSEAATARSNDELLADLAAQARFAPVLDDNGKLRGVALMNIASDSTLERLGLRSDDVVTAIEGVQVDSSGAAMNVARGLGFAQPVRLDIERHGVPTVVMVNPASLQRR